MLSVQRELDKNFAPGLKGFNLQLGPVVAAPTAFGLFNVGPTQFSKTDYNSIVNLTTPTHSLHPGLVSHTVGIVDGRTTITTNGIGFGAPGTIGGPLGLNAFTSIHNEVLTSLGLNPQARSTYTGS